jgi:hypothetical protein
MLKANEAWAITEKSDKYEEQLAQIEVLIQNEAERGGACTWWYCENMAGYEREILVKRLEEFGYVVTTGKDVIYIDWRDASKE